MTTLEKNDDHFWLWQRNVVDKYKDLQNEEVKADLKKNAFPFAVLMFQILGDFNFGSVVRSANFFGARDIFYYGKRRWDKRSSLGCYLYKDITHLSSLEELKCLKDRYSFVALENNIDRASINLKDFCWKKNSMILIGEEGQGLSDDILDLADSLVEIPNHGSIRSLNAAVAGSLAMSDYINKTG